MTAIDLALRELPYPEWNQRYELLLADPWLRKKTERIRRLREHQDYLLQNCQEVRDAAPGLVIDIGPGPGEFLEICRGYGHDVLGIDAPTGQGGMGHAYVELSRLMQERQQIPVDRRGLAIWLCHTHREKFGTTALINSRGSIEQAFAEFLIGEPHHLHQDCRRLSWDIRPELRTQMQWMFEVFADLLRPGGSILIHANGAANVAEYDELIVECARKVTALDLVRREERTLHKWTKR